MINSKIFSDYLSYGLSVIPCKEKRPTISSWQKFQTTLPTPQEIADFSGPQIACICGRVSGGLVCIDFDIKNGDRYDQWLTLINENAPELLSKIICEKTPSGGYHIVFKTPTEIRNLKLACNTENKCMIETRGEGGYFVCAPSENYELQFGDFYSISKLTKEETEFIISSARSFNEFIVEHYEKIHAAVHTNSNGITPFDDYDSKNTPVDMLLSHGWSICFKRGDAVYLKRPGKEGRAISATWNSVPGRFYCFSTSTQFENDKYYKASAVYTILEHGGNYNAAAKALYDSGYGERKEKKEEKEYKTILLRTDDILNKIIDIKINGYKKGKTTGWKTLDKLYSVAKRQFTVITGVPSSGKSEFMDDLAVHLAINDNWKFAVFSPENYPAEMHFHKLIEKICGDELRNCKDEDIETAFKFIEKHFFFIDALEEDISLESILSQTLDLVNNQKIDALIIDPWNEVELSKPDNMSETEFIGKCLRKSRKFARKNDIHLFIIAHPTKLLKNKDGEYPIPELWDVSGSAHWRNKADNGICVHRDYEKNETVIYVQKIKFKYCGKQGECILKYDLKSGRYYEDGQQASWWD
jgi:hypothetical protein